ncbi:hypothetical protein [Micromonospora sp. NPDC049891]|uniref:hypothetical protein n=1 Tax=Micromonospora sp. NPDC049891 TaxID=3155655 RepID=UPI0033E3DF85
MTRSAPPHHSDTNVHHPRRTVAMTGSASPTAENAAALVAARRADSARRRQRVLDALIHLATHGGDTSISGVARFARVHRTFIYRHPDLLNQVRSLDRDEDPEA